MGSGKGSIKRANSVSGSTNSYTVTWDSDNWNQFIASTNNQEVHEYFDQVYKRVVPGWKPPGITNTELTEIVNQLFEKMLEYKVINLDKTLTEKLHFYISHDISRPTEGSESAMLLTLEDYDANPIASIGALLASSPGYTYKVYQFEYIGAMIQNCIQKAINQNPDFIKIILENAPTKQYSEKAKLTPSENLNF